jgi:protein gp37
MGDRSNIEWTDASWTPIRARNLATGKIGWHCEHATTGCEFYYAEGMNKRLGTGLPFKPGHRADIEIFLDDEMLLAPLRWKKPRRIFVCSMTDAFADFVTDEWLDKIFAVMALCPQPWTWLPKSKIEFEKISATTVKVTLPEWLAREKRLI